MRVILRLLLVLAAWMPLPVLAQSVTNTSGADARQFGADPTGVNDAVSALNACFTANAVCNLPPGNTFLVNSGNLTIPANHTLWCSGFQSNDVYGPADSNSATIVLNSSYSIIYGGNSVSVRGCRIVPAGMTFPQSNAYSWVGTAVITGNYTGGVLTGVKIMGFDVCVNANLSLGFELDGMFDCNGGARSGGNTTPPTSASVIIGNPNINDKIGDVEVFPLATGTSCPGAIRGLTGPSTGLGTGILFENNDGNYTKNLVAMNYNLYNIAIVAASANHFTHVWSDNFCNLPNSATGLLIYNSLDTEIAQLNLNETNTGVLISDQQRLNPTPPPTYLPNYELSTHFGDVFVGSVGADAIDLGATTGTPAQEAGGTLIIDSLRTNQSGAVAAVGGYAINYQDPNHGNTKLILKAGGLFNVHGGTAPYISIPSTAYASDLRIAPDISTDLAAPATLYGTDTVSCTGLGTGGTCTLAGSNNTQQWISPYAGVAQLKTGTGPSSSGAVTITFSYDVLYPICVVAFSNADTAWGTTGSPRITPKTATTIEIDWSQTAALAASSSYDLAWQCLPQ